MRDMRVFFILGLAPLGFALDVSLVNFKCNKDLPVSITNLTLNCNGTSRCALGSNVDIQGEMVYNGLHETGFYNGDDESMFLSAKMSLMSLEYNLMNSYQVPVCWFDSGVEQAVAASTGNFRALQSLLNVRKLNDDNSCPADGSYPFSMNFRLPTNDNGASNWIASGWGGTLVLNAYAVSQVEYPDTYQNFYLGRCEAKLNTAVSTNAEKGSGGGFAAPSAAATTGIIFAILAALLLMCLFCYCCLRRKPKRKFIPADGEDVTSSFRRMETDDIPSKDHANDKVV